MSGKFPTATSSKYITSNSQSKIDLEFQRELFTISEHITNTSKNGYYGVEIAINENMFRYMVKIQAYLKSKGYKSKYRQKSNSLIIFWS